MSFTRNPRAAHQLDPVLPDAIRALAATIRTAVVDEKALEDIPNRFSAHRDLQEYRGHELDTAVQVFVAACESRGIRQQLVTRIVTRFRQGTVLAEDLVHFYHLSLA